MSEQLNNRFKFILGDESGDGHRITETLTIDSNYTCDECKHYYELACDKLNFKFHNKIATGYQESGLGQNELDFFIDNKVITEEESEDLHYLYSENFVWLLEKFIQHVKPDLRFVISYEGYDCFNSIHSFGYGLY